MASQSSIGKYSSCPTPTMDAPDTPAERFEPTQLGMYTVIDDIAEGTFGKVKSASQAFHLFRPIS
jgi:hypothetical protein